MSKASKLIYFTAKSQEHDINIKLRSILKWLKSGHEVRVRIEGSSEKRKAMESIYQQLENDVKQNATFLQKIVKPDSIKFVMKPTVDAADIKISKSHETKPVVNSLSAEDLLSDEYGKELDESISRDRPKRK